MSCSESSYRLSASEVIERSDEAIESDVDAEAEGVFTAWEVTDTIRTNTPATGEHRGPGRPITGVLIACTGTLTKKRHSLTLCGKLSTSSPNEMDPSTYIPPHQRPTSFAIGLSVRSVVMINKPNRGGYGMTCISSALIVVVRTHSSQEFSFFSSRLFSSCVCLNAINPTPAAHSITVYHFNHLDHSYGKFSTT